MDSEHYLMSRSDKLNAICNRRSSGPVVCETPEKLCIDAGSHPLTRLRGRAQISPEPFDLNKRLLQCRTILRQNSLLAPPRMHSRRDGPRCRPPHARQFLTNDHMMPPGGMHNNSVRVFQTADAVRIANSTLPCSNASSRACDQGVCHQTNPLT